jgi:hypothetical protein
MADIPDGFDEAKLTKLAREEVLNVRRWPDVLEDYGISDTEFYEISKDPHYRRAKEAFALDWNATVATPERVKLTAAVLLERGLPIIDKRMHDDGEPFNSVIEAYKNLARTAGIGEAKGEQKSTERFSITINLGEDDIKTYDKTIVGEVVADTEVIDVPRVIETKASSAPVSPFKRGPGRPRKG